METDHGHASGSAPGCPQCLVRPSLTRSAKFAWIVAALLAAVLAAVFFIGLQNQWSLVAAGGGLFLFMMLLCPLLMGGMMWMMMRMNRQL